MYSLSSTVHHIRFLADLESETKEIKLTYMATPPDVKDLKIERRTARANDREINKAFKGLEVTFKELEIRHRAFYPKWWSI